MNITKESSGRITVTFPYSPQLVEKVRTIEGRKWHKDKKYWSFPNTDGNLEKILNVFEGEEVHLDPTLKKPSPLAGEGKGEGDFEALKRELLSRKYSYRTVKGYIYCSLAKIYNSLKYNNILC